MKTTEKLQQIFIRIPLFADLPQQVIEELISLSKTVLFPKGKFIARQGSQVDFLYFIISGNIKIVQANEKGKELNLALLGAGDHIGLSSMFSGNSRNTDVISVSKSELIQIPSDAFQELLKHNAALSFKLLESVSKRLFETSRHLAESHLCSLEQRLTIRLLEMAEPTEFEEDNLLIINELPSHQELAAMLGVSRESITRTLINLESRGYIETENGQLFLTASHFDHSRSGLKN